MTLTTYPDLVEPPLGDAAAAPAGTALGSPSDNERAHAVFRQRLQDIPGVIQIECRESGDADGRAALVHIRQGDLETEYAVYDAIGSVYKDVPGALLDVEVCFDIRDHAAYQHPMTSGSSLPLKPQALRHLELARRNVVLYREFPDRPADLDWATTFLFYAALPLIQAHPVQNSATGFDVPRGHPERDRAVFLRLPAIAPDYRYLQARSTHARSRPEVRHPTAEELRKWEGEQLGRILAEIEERGIPLLAE